MAKKETYQALTEEQIKTLVSQGCTAEDFKQVLVVDGLDISRIRNSHFSGQVKIGQLSGKVKSIHGLEKACGIYNAAIADCTIGDGVRIANVGVHIANYDITAGVCIEDVAVMQVPVLLTALGDVAHLNDGDARCHQPPRQN